MMSEVAISCQHLSKQYRLGELQGYKTLRDAMTDAAASPLRAAQSVLKRGKNGHSAIKRATKNSIWALNNVSFEVKRGEVVGIVGRNGAGKSTLLKILSRITKPTKGHAQIHGRVGSLLEVGTGFHPELTGRENIYLNAAILGMRQAEVQRKFDDIVEFAEVEKFIDTPVKRYSSGMYVRLAFAVAAHLETEVLLVDEVLAVGDAQFQKKCFEKMREIGQGGRTIIFVSHNMAAVRSICKNGLELESGGVSCLGEINKVVDGYLARFSRATQVVAETPSFSITEVSISSLNGAVIKTFDRVEVKVQFTPKVEIKDPGVYVSISTVDNLRLAGLDFKDFRSIPSLNAGESAEMGFVLESLPLLPGTYQIEVHLKDMAAHKIEIVPRSYSFDVAETQVYGGRKLDSWFGHLGLNAQAVAHSFGAEELTALSAQLPVNVE